MASTSTLTRMRLSRMINTALRTRHVIVRAPAGYGKSTLLRELCAQRPNTHYFPLTLADADLGALRARLEPRLVAGATVILDDIHHIVPAPDVWSWLMTDVLGLPSAAPAWRCVLGGRQAPVPNEQVLRAEGKVSILTAEELAFSLDECRAIGWPDAWHARTQGWPLALALLAQLGLDQTGPATAAVFDSLAEAVFTELPKSLRRFIQVTAVPVRFSAELAGALLGADHAQASLDEVLRRNFFIEPDQSQGWFRYHDLIRDFCIAQQRSEASGVFVRAAAWFESRGDLPAAIEHALAGQDYERAAGLLHSLPRRFVWERQRQRTFHRWIASLPEAIQAKNPILLLRLGRELLDVGQREDAWRHLRLAAQYADLRQETSEIAQVRLGFAVAHLHDGQSAASISECRAVLGMIVADSRLQRWTHNVLGSALALASQFPAAKREFEAALGLPEDDLTRPNPFYRNNLISTILLPLGDFDAARRLLQMDIGYFADKPAERVWHMLGWCGLHEGAGDWTALSVDLRAIEQAEAEAEQPDNDDLWRLWYQAYLHIGLGDFHAATRTLDRAQVMAGDDPERNVCVALARVWGLRRQARLDEAIHLADEVLARDWPSPLYRAALALEREMARFSAYGPAEPRWPEEIRGLMPMRARVYLVRWRALLALQCHAMGEPGWRKHAQTVLRQTGRPGYESILVAREPDLGAEFWALCVAEDMEIVRATAALKVIGDISPLVRRLAAPRPRQTPDEALARIAQALAELGHEAAIPHLVNALQSASDAASARMFENALAALERGQPPALHVRLLGGFEVIRNGSAITDEAWHRPVVRRLFQYFALRRGEHIPRDRILEDLWADEDPKAAATTFRTVHARLRKAVEPHLRAKAESRYFQVEGDVYRFDPFGVVSVDVEVFIRTVRDALRDSGRHDVAPLPETLLNALQSWRPLLPQLPYADWLIEPRERLQRLYVEGGLYAANALLVRGSLRESLIWVERVLAEAPWVEEAYEVRMRCHARLDERGFALKAYDDCAAALRRELGAEPSPHVRWLAERLRRGESI